ncbi:MAG: primosomal protein N' [Gammaproteobacteria bacterium]
MPVTPRVYLRVAVPSPLHTWFDYLPPVTAPTAALMPGVRVRVPFGKREAVGVLLELSAHTEVAAGKLKPARAVLDSEPLIPGDLLALARWAADYYHHPIGEVLQTLLPVALRRKTPKEGRHPICWRLSTAGVAADLKLMAHAPRQLAVWQALNQAPAGLDARQLGARLKNWRAPLQALAQRGWAQAAACAPVTTAAVAPQAAVTLNAAQTEAAGKISAALGGFTCFLLDGVTGSGKTEVYMEVIAETLRRGQQALLLVPEIGLTPQLLARLARRFTSVAALHSALGAGERLQTWLAARDGRVSIVVGTRSAVFVPLRNPGVIIVDEEHDTSFKQQDGLRYSARDLAVVRAQRHGIPVVLGSATPSLESLHNVAQLRYRRLGLPERAGAAQHPRMQLLDVRGVALQDGLSPALIAAIHRHLASRDQVLLFLNRRGYAPTVLCHTCGATLQCRRCDARLTLHANRRLICHWCGAEHPLPERCPACGAPGLGQVGAGTERVEAGLAREFPGAAVARLDRDNLRRRGRLAALLEGIRERDFQILVGTQMLAKGHDFPGVTLAAVLDADQGLFGSDFRASERMAQLIYQVAGRAGRAARPGEVLIQTHHPDHPMLVQLLHAGYASFAQRLLAERQHAGLPPCAAMALLRAEASACSVPLAFLHAARTQLAPACGRQVQLLGPAPAPMERRAGRFRAQLMLLSAQRGLLQRALGTALPRIAALRNARHVRWSVDVDPVETA